VYLAALRFRWCTFSAQVDDVIFRELEIPGVFIVDIEPFADERGTFARTFCTDEFAAHGLETVIAQCNLSTNPAHHTLRGMHLQLPPHEEAKLVRCVRGSLFDVVVDLRRGSPSLGEWVGVELHADQSTSLSVPRGMAHGFLTLEDNTEVFYQMSEFYAPEYAKGFRWNDPTFGIEWPSDVQVISERDRSYPNFSF